MWTYRTNLMGPAGIWWYEENNIPFEEITSYSPLFKKNISYKRYKPYGGGRIDCYCNNPSDEEFCPYNRELGLSIMEMESYSLFSEWLSKFSSDEFIRDVNLLYYLFKKEEKKDLKFFKKNK